jgi:hypothetical protein
MKASSAAKCVTVYSSSADDHQAHCASRSACLTTAQPDVVDQAEKVLVLLVDLGEASA